MAGRRERELCEPSPYVRLEGTAGLGRAVVVGHEVLLPFAVRGRAEVGQLRIRRDRVVGGKFLADEGTRAAALWGVARNNVETIARLDQQEIGTGHPAASALVVRGRLEVHEQRDAAEAVRPRRVVRSRGTRPGQGAGSCSCSHCNSDQPYSKYSAIVWTAAGGGRREIASG